MEFEAPISRHQETVRPEWTDYNGHMNVAYFVLIFDNATDVFYPLLGLGKPYRERTGHSTFAVESHITYSREASVGEPVRVTTQLLGFDEKRIHYFHIMSHAEKGYQMATLEQLAVHVNLAARKVCAIPRESLALFEQMARSHSILPTPREVGSVMALRSKKSAA